MPMTQQSLLIKISRAAAAVKDGQLDTYATAKQLQDSDQGVQLSWGPAMRR